MASNTVNQISKSGIGEYTGEALASRAPPLFEWYTISCVIKVNTERETLILLYPYKFTDFLWVLFELDYYQKYVNVEVWDLSRLLNRSYAKKIAGDHSQKPEVLQLTSVFQFISELSRLKKCQTSRIIFLNKIGVESPLNLIIRKLLQSYFGESTASFVEFFNSGVPINTRRGESIDFQRKLQNSSWKKVVFLLNSSLSLQEIQKRAITYACSQISRRLSFPLTHVLVAGNDYYNFIKPSLGSEVTILFGHSNDYSAYRIHETKAKNTVVTRSESAVLLDSASPYFKSDEILTKRGSMATVEKWYPSLNRFFKLVEERFDISVEIAGHYKSKFASPSTIFGNRIVRYGETISMVHSADFVLTKNSTAISFAVIYRKPILFIYSDELKDDPITMPSIKMMADYVGSTPINIDNPTLDIEGCMKIDEELYDRYIQDILTSNPNGLPNFAIILNHVLGLDVGFLD